MSPAASRSVRRRAHDAQQLVAGRVAERVVDLLEVVEVDEQHREPLVLRVARVQRVLEPVDEQRAVRQPGQRVVERAVRQLLLERDAVGHVARVEDDALARAGSSSRLECLLSTCRYPPSRWRQRTSTVPSDGPGCSSRRAYCACHPLAVVGVHDVERARADERLGRVAEDALDRGRLVADRAVALEHRDHVARVVDHRAVPGVGVAARELGAQPGRLERHAELVGEGLQRAAGLGVEPAGRADGEHALRLAPAQRQPHGVRSRPRPSRSRAARPPP